MHKHKYQLNLENASNTLSSCSIEAERTLHFFLRCHFFNDIRKILMNYLMNIDRLLSSLIQNKLISVLLHGSDSFDKTNSEFLVCTLQFINHLNASPTKWSNTLHASHSVHPPSLPPSLSAGGGRGGGEAPTKFSKKGGLTRP